MKKKIFALFISTILFFSSFYLPVMAEENETDENDEVVENFNVDASSAILMDQESGQILMAQNEHEKLAPASVTKIMTIYLIYKALDDGKISWDDIVNISEKAAGMGGSQIFLEENEKQSVKDLTKSIVIASANDSSLAMAEFLSGNESAFVSEMNKTAKEMGMKNTNFENTNGLDSDNHYSSAYDLAILSRNLLNNFPEVLELSQIWTDTIIHKTKRGDDEFQLANTNKLLKSYQGCTGLKTGSTSKAGACLAATAERNGLKLIAIVLKAPNSKIRFQEAIHMLDYGFVNYEVVKKDSKNAVIAEVQVDKGIKISVNALARNDLNVTVEKGSKVEIEQSIEIKERVKAPINKGDKLGEIIYKINDKEMAREDLIAEESVEKINFSSLLERLGLKWLGKY